MSNIHIFPKPQLWLALVLLISQAPPATAREGAFEPAASAATDNGQFTEYPVPSHGNPDYITAGPDGALWFTTLDYIGRLTTDGVITEYPIPDGINGNQVGIPFDITAGPDGALWFTLSYSGLIQNQIGRMTTAGDFTFYATPTQHSAPRGITAGPDGALWFAETDVNQIGRITTDGDITEYPIPIPPDPPIFYNSGPLFITAGPDGALWFTEFYDGHNIGRITTSGVITEFPLPDPENSSPTGITAGPDSALWFTDFYGNKIGRITTAGVVTEYPIPTPAAGPWDITAGADGALWFTEDDGGYNIGRITTAGDITEFPIPTQDAQSLGIAAGSDGALWFAEHAVNDYIGQIGRIQGELAMEVTADRTTVLATEMITATVVITNTGIQATSAVTLTLTEGEGMLYALRDEEDEGRFGTIEGLTNVVYFDALDFDPGEQKTFHIPLIISPLPDATDPSLPVTVTSVFSATNASGVTADVELEITANPLIDGPIEPSAFGSLPGMPVTDVGQNPDDPLGALGAELGSMAAVPSNGGDLWDIYLHDSMAQWTDRDKSIFKTLTELGFSKRDAYAAVYIRAIILLRPSGSCVPSKAQMSKAITTWYWGLQKAKWLGQPDAFNTAFTEAAKGLGGCSPLYPVNLLEFHSQYTTPMITAVQTSFAAWNYNETVYEQEIYYYITEGTRLSATPLPRLVEADVDYFLSRRQWHPILHNQIMAQVEINSATGGFIKLGTAIYKVINGDANIDGGGTPLYGYRKHWTALEVHSPLLPLVTDSQGRRSGLDAATGQLYDEIPGMVIEPGHPWVLLLPATTETLQVTWTTAYPYDFGINVQGYYSGTLTSQTSFTGTATAGYTANQTLAVTAGSNSVTISASPLMVETRLFLPLIVR